MLREYHSHAPADGHSKPTESEPNVSTDPQPSATSQCRVNPGDVQTVQTEPVASASLHCDVVNQNPAEAQACRCWKVHVGDLQQLTLLQ